MTQDERQEEATLEPTQHRLDEARRRGQVPRSADLVSAAVILAAAGLLAVLGGPLLDSLTRMTSVLLASGAGPADGAVFTSVLWQAATPVLLQVGIFVGVLVVVAALANLAQVGFLNCPSAVSPDPKRLWARAGLGGAASPRAIARVLAAVGKVAAVAAVTYWTLLPQRDQIMNLWQLSPGRLCAEAIGLAESLAMRAGAMLLVLAALDYLYQRWQHRRDLRMTPRQMREDLRQSEGDSQLRSRRRQQFRRLLAQHLPQGARGGVVVTSSAGYAVAVTFRPSMRAPVVVARASGAAAVRLQQEARQLGLAVVEDDPTAARLMRHVRVGQEAPRNLHEALAEMLAFAKEFGAFLSPATRLDWTATR